MLQYRLKEVETGLVDQEVNLKVEFENVIIRSKLRLNREIMQLTIRLFTINTRFNIHFVNIKSVTLLLQILPRYNAHAFHLLLRGYGKTQS